MRVWGAKWATTALGTFLFSPLGLPESQLPFWHHSEAFSMDVEGERSCSFLGKTCLCAFLRTKGKIKLSLSFQFYLLMPTLLKPGTHFILFTQCSAQGPLGCLLGTRGRNACSFNKTGICRRGDAQLLGS